MAIPSNNDVTHNRFLERYVLAVFYYATNGPEWEHQLNFLSPRDVCEWTKPVVTEGGTPLTMGVAMCKEMKVLNEGVQNFTSSLYFYSNDLKGNIPDEIGHLNHLRKFNLPSNPGITGALPRGLRKLEHLEDLELQYCGLSGTIPDWLGENLRSLTDLALSNNNMSGELPSSLFKLSALELLTLDDNLFDGDIANFGKLTNLVALYAEDAGIHGEITNQLLRSWNGLHDLDLSGNRIRGSLPSALFGMPDLVILDLSNNRITGSLPSIPHNNTSLRFLSLFENQIDGSIPPTIQNLQRLQHLDLGKNSLGFKFPSEIGSMTQLRYLHTNDNNFSAQPLPSFLGHLTSLKELSMNKNNLIGSIPSSISSMTSLLLFDVGQNSLDGSLPKAFSHLQDLNFLLLQRNRLTGTLPDAMALMYGLKLVLIDGNQITGSASVLCDHYVSSTQSYFVSDCRGDNPEVECTCCNVCCNEDNEEQCNYFDWSSNLDPLWEYAYQRLEHEFNTDPASPGELP